MSRTTDTDFTPGRLVTLTDRVSRVTAPNGGPMTGPGTNTYLVCGGPAGRDVAIVDAGPGHPAHLEALVSAIGGRRLAALLVTHTHIDHSPGTAPLAARFSAPRVGRVSTHPEFQDASFASDLVVLDGTRVAGDGWTLRAVPTPGHASNHVCWLLEEEGLVFTGDHVLGTTSPVILAPDGSMRDYLASLARLRAMELTELMPGHGPRLSQPARVLDDLVRHRMEREAQVVTALRAGPPATVGELVDTVYAVLPGSLKTWAAYSLEAHLIKLEEEGRVARDADRWSLREAADG